MSAGVQKKQSQNKPNLVRRRRIPQGQRAFRGLCGAEFLGGLKYGKAWISGFRETEIT